MTLINVNSQWLSSTRAKQQKTHWLSLKKKWARSKSTRVNESFRPNKRKSLNSPEGELTVRMTGGGSNRASYCEPKEIQDRKILTPPPPKKKTGFKISYPPKIQDLNTSNILIYSIKQLYDLKKYMTDLLTQKMLRV